MNEDPRKPLTIMCVLPGAMLIVIAVLADVLQGGYDGFAPWQTVLLSAGIIAMVLGVILARTLAVNTLKKVVFSGVVCLAIYLIAEISCSAFAYVYSSNNQTFRIFEESGRTIHFDPIRGYKLCTTPSRYARITNGEVEFVGTLKGNKQGFPDEHDFQIVKPDHVRDRYIVLGDSFTSAQFNQTNWPDFIEKQVDGKLELFNFSTDGGGLANWWSNLIKIVDQEDYEYDGVIFAVIFSDLSRKFSVCEHRGFDCHMFGRIESWDPKDFPKSYEESKKYLGARRNAPILPAEEFEVALRNKRLNRKLPKSLYENIWIANNCKQLFNSAIKPAKHISQPDKYFVEGQLKLINDIRETLSKRNIDPIVVYIPLRNELIDPATSQAEYGKEFARLLDGTFVDGTDAFEGLDSDEIREQFFPYDGHWNQKGSDRFGGFMLKHLIDQEALVSEVGS